MKKKWLTIGIPVAVVAIAIILFAFRGGSSSPTELVNGFEEAVKNGDTDALMNLATLDNDVTWNEEQAESLINHLQEDNNDLDDQLMLLHAQASYYESEGQANNVISQMYPGESIVTVGPFYIAEEEAFIGKDYKLKVRGYQLTAEAPEGTTITFNGEDIVSDSEDTVKLGMVGPGIYTIKGQKDYDYTTVTDEKEVTVFDMEDFEETITLNVSGDTVSLNSNTPNTVLYVNGDQSDIIIEKDSSFGPVREGITLKGVAEFPWGVGESEEITIEEDIDSYDLTPKTITSDDTKNEITEIINEFAQNRIATLVEQDIELLKNVSDNLRKEYTNRISTFDDRHYVKGNALGTRIDFSNVTYKHGRGGKNLIYVPVEFHDEFVEVFRFSRNEDLEERFQERIVILEYKGDNDNAWVINNIENDNNALFDEDYMTGDEVVRTSF